MHTHRLVLSTPPRMTRLSRFLTAAVIGGSILSNAHALIIDFNTAATGANIVSSPLLVSEGTISLTTTGPSTTTVLASFSTNPTRFLHHVNDPNNGFAVMTFSFDVSSITFDYTGYGGGSFLAEALDINGTVIGSFFDANAIPPDWNVGASITAAGIRSFRFRDTVSEQSGVDNLNITVPDMGATTSLLALAMLALAAGRRRLTRS